MPLPRFALLVLITGQHYLAPKVYSKNLEPLNVPGWTKAMNENNLD